MNSRTRLAYILRRIDFAVLRMKQPRCGRNCILDRMLEEAFPRG